MHEVLSVRKYSKPWEPSPLVRPLLVLEQKGHPLTGLLDLQGDVVLFTRFDQPDGLWAYTVVSDAERWRLMSAPGTQDFGEVLYGLFADRLVTIARAPSNAIDTVYSVVSKPLVVPGARARGMRLAFAELLGLDEVDGEPERSTLAASPA